MQKFSLHRLLAFASVATITASALQSPSICMISPIAAAGAGQSLTASINNPQGGPCEANIVFSDQQFLPVNFAFRPMTCLGSQQAEIAIPSEAPNGVATIMWECSGSGAQSCSRILIDGGSGNLEAINTQQSGTVECVVPVATLTTLETITQSSTTLVEPAVSTVFNTSVESSADLSTTVMTMPTFSASTEERQASGVSSPTGPSSAASSSSTTMSASMSASISTSTPASKETSLSDCSCSKTATASNGSPFN